MFQVLTLLRFGHSQSVECRANVLIVDCFIWRKQRQTFKIGKKHFLPPRPNLPVILLLKPHLHDASRLAQVKCRECGRMRFMQME
jgi:hypothetical protein